MPALTPTYLRWRYTVSQCVLIGALLYMTAGWVSAQSQDYINATVAANMMSVEARVTSLDRKVAAIDDRMWYVLVGIAGSLLAQIVNLRNNWKNGK